MSKNEVAMYLWVLIFVLIFGGGVLGTVLSIGALYLPGLVYSLFAVIAGLYIGWVKTAKLIEDEWYK